MYKLKVAQAGSLKFDGYPVNTAANPITINDGWTWIGFLPQAGTSVTNALACINPVANDYVKSQTVSTIYYEGYGWFGDLTQLLPLNGYMVKTTHAETLTYTGGEPLKITDDGGPTTINSETDWKPEAFEYSGQVTAVASINGQNVESEGFALYSLVDGRVRGESRASYFEPTGLYVFNHLIFSNIQEGETVGFRLFDSHNNQWYEFDETIDFTADMIVGNATEPFILKTSHLLEPSALSLKPSLSVWPNPVSDQLHIQVDLPIKEHVNLVIMDNLGRVIERKDEGDKQPGRYMWSMDIQSLVPGIYHMSLEGQSKTNQKFIKKQ